MGEVKVQGNYPSVLFRAALTEQPKLASPLDFMAISIQRFMHTLRHLRSGLLIALVWLAATLPALAQKAQAAKEEPTGPAPKSYLFPYAIVALAIVLGLLVVCRPTKRKKDPDFGNDDS